MITMHSCAGSTISQQTSTHWNNVGLLLSQRCRRWPYFKPTLFQCLVFTGMELGWALCRPLPPANKRKQANITDQTASKYACPILRLPHRVCLSILLGIHSPMDFTCPQAGQYHLIDACTLSKEKSFSRKYLAPSRTEPETRPAVFWTAHCQSGRRKISPDSTKLHCGRTPHPVLAQQFKFGLPFIISWLRLWAPLLCTSCVMMTGITLILGTHHLISGGGA